MDLFQKDASLIFRICWRMIKAGSMKQLGEKLRIMRKMRELTQGDVAEFLHIDNQPILIMSWARQIRRWKA